MSCGCDDCGAENIQLDVINGVDGDSVGLTSGPADPVAPPPTEAGIYINTTTMNLWAWVSGASAWVDYGTLLGTPGADGADGADGTDGASAEVYFDVSNPASPADDPAPGNSGVWFNTTSGHLFVWPTGASAWADAGLYRGLGYGGHSITPTAIGLGSKTITTQADLAYLPGMRIRVANDASNWMEGTITAYNIVSGSLTFTSDLVAGSGTFALWNIGIAGMPGAPGLPGGAGAVGRTPVLYSGTAEPAGVLGLDGDQYIRQINERYLAWRQKVLGSWATLPTGFIRVPGYVGTFSADPNTLGLGTNFNTNDYGFQWSTPTFTVWRWNGTVWVTALSFSVSGGGSGATMATYRYIDNVGGTDIRVYGETGGIAIPFGQSVIIDGATYTHNSDTVHEIETPGNYQIDVTSAIVSGSGNPRLEIWLEKSTGGGAYSEILGTRSWANTSGEKNTNASAHIRTVVPLVGNDRIRVMASGGTGNVPQLLKRYGSSITILKIG